MNESVNNLPSGKDYTTEALCSSSGLKKFGVWNSLCLNHECSKIEDMVINCIEWTPIGDKLILGLSNGEVSLYDRTFGEKTRKSILSWSGISTVKCRGEVIVFGDQNGGVHIYSAQLLPIIMLRDLNGHSIYDLHVYGGSNKIVGIARDTEPVLWDTSTVKVERRFTDIGFGSTCLDGHTHSTLFAIGLTKGGISIQDTRQDRIIYTLSHHSGECKHVKFSSCGRYLLSYGDEGNICIWDSRSTSPLLEKCEQNVEKAIWHSISSHIISTGNTVGKISHYDIRGENITKLVDINTSESIGSMAYHPLSDFLATSCHSGFSIWSKINIDEMPQCIEEVDNKISKTRNIFNDALNVDDPKCPNIVKTVSPPYRIAESPVVNVQSFPVMKTYQPYPSHYVIQKYAPN